MFLGKVSLVHNRAIHRIKLVGQIRMHSSCQTVFESPPRTRRWVFQARGRVDSSPVVCRDRIVVGSDDGRLYLIDRTTGAQVWAYDVGEAVVSSPAVVPHWVVIGADDGRVYAFRPVIP